MSCSNQATQDLRHHFPGKKTTIMSTENYTEFTERKLTDSCTEDLTGDLRWHLTFLSVVNIFLAITAILGNTLILVALHHESSLHPPSKLLLRCLATTDLSVGLISQPLSVAFWISIVVRNWTFCRLFSILTFMASYLLGSVSLLTLTVIGVERLLALMLGLRYRQVVTCRRISVTLALIWIVSTVAAMISRWNALITTWYGYIGISLSLTTSTFSYSMIFWRLRQHQTRLNVQTNQMSALDYPIQKAVSSALWLQLALIACYLPFQITDINYDPNNVTPSVFLAAQHTFILVYLNSTLNPILYCWKIG